MRSIYCIRRINNTQEDDASYIDVTMPMYNLIEYNHNYLKTSGILWQFYRDVSSVNVDGAVIDFIEANAITESFSLKVKLTGQIGNNRSKHFEIMVPLKHLSNFWRSPEMSSINWEITLDLNWSGKCIIKASNVANQGIKFAITDTKLYVLVVTLSTQDNVKLLEQLKPGFRRTINCNKYQSKKLTGGKKQYLDYLIDPSSQELNRLFVLSFEDEAPRTSDKRFCLPTREMKNYTFMIAEQNFFNQPVRNDLITYDNIQKIATGQRNDYTTGLLEYDYFK